MIHKLQVLKFVVRTNATSQNGFWFEKGTVNSQYSLFQEGGVIQWRQYYTNISSLNNLSTTTASYMTTGVWYQVVGTFTSGSRKLYINGSLVNSVISYQLSVIS